MKLRNRLIRAIAKINLIDKILMLIMLILLVQSTYNLFANEAVSQATSNIDIIVRTSSAAIFGYFLSTNFVKRESVILNSDTEPVVPAITAGNKEQIVKNKNNQNHCNKLQIITVSVIGIFSLCVLLILRNFITITPETTATISQLRDFVSACVGFLIGCGKIVD